MPYQAPKTNWTTADGVADTDLNRIEGNIADINARATFQNAGGTATAITLGTAPQVDGVSVTFIASADNNAAATTVNGLPLYKPGGTTAPTLKAGKPYTIWYSSASTCFFFKASATGTATPAQVLANVPYSNESDTDLIGTMPDKTGSGTVITPSGTDQAIPQGYFPGGTADGKVAAVVVPVANVLTGTTIAGQSGTMPEQGSPTFTPTTVDQAITPGHYSGGTVKAGYALGVSVPLERTSIILDLANGGFKKLPVLISPINIATNYYYSKSAIDVADNLLFVGQANGDGLIWKVDLTTGSSITSINNTSINGTNYYRMFFIGGFLYILGYGNLLKYDTSLTLKASVTSIAASKVVYSVSENCFFVFTGTDVRKYDMNLTLVSTLYTGASGSADAGAIDSNYLYVVGRTTKTVQKIRRSDSTVMWNITKTWTPNDCGITSTGLIVSSNVPTAGKVYKLSLVDGSDVVNNSIAAGNCMDIITYLDYTYVANGQIYCFDSNLVSLQSLGTPWGTSDNLMVSNNLIYTTVQRYNTSYSTYVHAIPVCTVLS